MIIDTINNMKMYEAVNPLFKSVTEFLEKNDIAKLPLGKHTIAGDDLFVNICDAAGKTKDEARLESHNEMIDIQIPISTTETMGYAPRQGVEEPGYDPANDITFYDFAAQQYIDVHPGMFVIFFPGDLHAPCIAKETIHKAIFKVKNNY